MNQNLRLRTLRAQFAEVAQFFDKEIWFVKIDNSLFVKKMFPCEAEVQSLFYYFDLIG